MIDLFPKDYKMSKFSEMLWRSAFALYFKGFYNLKIYGQENVPKEGGCIIAPNHVSNIDPPLMGLAMPRAVYFMAKEELFQHNVIFTNLIRWLGAFPVHREGKDKTAIRRSMNLLKRGDLLGIFPQGARREEGIFEELHDGVASFALRTGCPIIPVAIVGSAKLVRNKLAVSIGKPIIVEKAKPTTEAIAKVNEVLKEKVLTLYNETKATFT